MSTVILDTITGKSTATTITIGSTPVVSASANSMTIRGEGSNQTSIQQGLAKAWLNFTGTGTIAIVDNNNVGSITDNGTGDYNFAFATNMGNATYNMTGMGGHNSTSMRSITQPRSVTAPTTSTVRVQAVSADGAINDPTVVHITIHGDLA